MEVEVLYLHELLAETLEQPDVREHVVTATMRLAGVRPRVGSPASAWIEALPPLHVLPDRT